MKNAIVAIGLFWASNITLAANSATEIYSLKNGGLKFAPSYQQGLMAIKQNDSRIQLIPAPTPKDDTGVPYAILCANVQLSNEKFKKLTKIDVTAQTKIPSAMMKSGYGGTVTIGSDRIAITADFPNPDTTSQDFYKIRTGIDVVSTDPNTKSSRNMSILFFKNGAATDGAQSARSTLKIGKYHSVGFHVFLKKKEYYLEAPPTPVSPRISASLSSSFFVKSDFSSVDDGLDSTSMTSELPLGKSENSLAAKKLEEHKISICWSPNNYTSVTTEEAELINPEVELRYSE